MVDILGLFSRRGVMLGAGGLAAAATVEGAGRAGSFAQLLRPTDAGRPSAALQTASYDDWALQVGSKFIADTGHVLELVDVQGFPAPGARPGRLRDKAFVARFDITKGEALPEALYRVAHPNGVFEIALEKGSPDKPLRMLAVFN